MALTVRFDTGYIPNTYKLLVLFGHTGTMLKLALTAASVLVFLGIYRRQSVLALITTHADHRPWRLMPLVHGAAFALLVLVTWLIFHYAYSRHFFLNFGVMAWFALAGATIASWLLSAFPLAFWRDLVLREWRWIGSALMLGVLGWFLGREIGTYADLLGDLTFQACQQLLGVFFDPIVADITQKQLGVPPFVVSIQRECSGYEGIVLVTMFLTMYLWLYRDTLRFPRALLLFPIGLLTIWGLNVLRIASLIAIGAQFSSRIALGGFHSAAGWISFVLTTLALILLVHRSRFFVREEAQAKRHPGEERLPTPASSIAATALLLPFIVLLSSILLTQAFTDEFDWLYPLRVIACAAVLWVYRAYYRKLLVAIRWQAVLIGAALLPIWLLLVPPDPEADLAFAGTLSAAPALQSILWIAFRIVGAVVTVPVIEELLFRGYLINRLTGDEAHRAFGRFTLLSFAISSLLFGFLHGQWLAGTVAGAAFAGALYVRHQLMDAIVAHMTTNALLALYVVATGHWSLW